jgi:U3 small nucleolar RNA-associated protein 6
LQTLIAGYPTPETLRRSLLDHLHVRLAEALPEDAASVVLRATRALAVEEEKLSGVGLVEALRCANEEMLAALEPPSEGMAKAYAQFVEEWIGKEDLDAHLVCIYQLELKDSK